MDPATVKLMQEARRRREEAAAAKYRAEEAERLAKEAERRAAEANQVEREAGAIERTRQERYKFEEEARLRRESRIRPSNQLSDKEFSELLWYDSPRRNALLDKSWNDYIRTNMRGNEASYDKLLQEVTDNQYSEENIKYIKDLISEELRNLLEQNFITCVEDERYGGNVEEYIHNIQAKYLEAKEKISRAVGKTSDFVATRNSQCDGWLEQILSGIQEMIDHLINLQTLAHDESAKQVEIFQLKSLSNSLVDIVGQFVDYCWNNGLQPGDCYFTTYRDNQKVGVRDIDAKKAFNEVATQNKLLINELTSDPALNCIEDNIIDRIAIRLLKPEYDSGADFAFLVQKFEAIRNIVEENFPDTVIFNQEGCDLVKKQETLRTSYKDSLSAAITNLITTFETLEAGGFRFSLAEKLIPTNIMNIANKLKQALGLFFDIKYEITQDIEEDYRLAQQLQNEANYY